MSRPHSFVAGALFGLAMALAMPAGATLPALVNGQPLPSLAPMLKGVTPAVVNISSKTHVRVRDPFLDDPVFRRFFGLPGTPRERVEQSLGSGVIVDAAKGYVLTNNHVVKGADDITVTLQDGRNFKASVVGTDPATDIAVVKIPAERLTALPVADSSKVQVGDFVVAVGDPFGLGQTVTSGIVSALQRTGLGNTYQNFIQTDASINPGNSGGALVNLAGQLVGINSMIYSPSGASAGIGFAIPSNLALSVMRQLVSFGHVRRGNLGLEAQDITPRIAAALGIDPNQHGALVTRIDEHAAAAKAGVQPGDVITAVNGEAIHDSDALRNAEGLLPVGQTVTLKVLRDGKTQDISTRMTPETLAQASGAEVDPRLRGATLSDLPRHQQDTGLYGVRISALDSDSRAAASGLAAGDIIIAAGRARVGNLATLQRLLANPPARLVLTVLRDQQALYVPMR
ncbi:MAG TPA: DegQ family serine endoprotease [Rhodanobacteraceae bacterium]|nr:DegQ family serine endoprotease [Rhodanobacteraceae bacterium]